MRPWKRVPNIRRYYCRFTRRLLADSFGYFWGQVVSGLVLGVMAILIAKPPGVLWAIGIALISYGLIVVLTLLINAIRAPVKLDNHRGMRISALRNSTKNRVARIETGHMNKIGHLANAISELKATHQSQIQTLATRKHPADEGRYNQVRDNLLNFTEPEKRSLRMLLENGEMWEGSLNTDLDRDTIKKKGIACLLVKERIEEKPGGIRRYYRINEEHKEALRDLLYPDSTS